MRRSPDRALQLTVRSPIFPAVLQSVARHNPLGLLPRIPFGATHAPQQFFNSGIVGHDACCLGIAPLPSDCRLVRLWRSNRPGLPRILFRVAAVSPIAALGACPAHPACPEPAEGSAVEGPAVSYVEPSLSKGQSVVSSVGLPPIVHPPSAFTPLRAGFILCRLPPKSSSTPNNAVCNKTVARRHRVGCSPRAPNAHQAESDETPRCSSPAAILFQTSCAAPDRMELYPV